MQETETKQKQKKEKKLEETPRVLRVEILGKGKDELRLKSTTTIGELRKKLKQDPDVQAVNEDGQPLTDEDQIGDTEQVSFIPNVAGGKT